MVDKKYTTLEKIKHYGKRFLRTFLPQVPAICTAVAGVDVKYTLAFSFIGAIATTVDKWLRENTSWYPLK